MSSNQSSKVVAKKKASKTSSTKPKTVELPIEVVEVLKFLKPLTDFHQKAHELQEDDVSLYFHVRAVRGSEEEGEVLADIEATNTLPGALGKVRVTDLVTSMETTLQSSIMDPILSKMQELANAIAMDQEYEVIQYEDEVVPELATEGLMQDAQTIAEEEG